MNYAVCSVLCINRRWFVDCGLTRHGPYTSVETATLVALGEARTLHRKEGTVKVSIQNEDGRIASEFIVGSEPTAACE